MSFTLFSAMKNEAPFLLEWVAYHKAIGFDRIVIYSNDSDAARQSCWTPCRMPARWSTGC